jgi:hypothetical protein
MKPITSLRVESNPDLDRKWEEQLGKDEHLYEYIKNTLIFKFPIRDTNIRTLKELLYDTFIYPEYEKEVRQMEYERNTREPSYPILGNT